MIGLVIVSHSAKLAEGVQELVDQMTQGQVPLAVAGGIEDPENPFGTDAFRVQQAIEAVYSDDGVIVLMDLGSALLSAEMALEFLPEEQQANIRLCEAPLVEGAIAAAVQITASNDIEQALVEARAALTAKAVQLQGETVELSTPSTPPPGTMPLNEIQLTIGNRLGLHARPAAQFVRTAASFQSEITVRNLTQGLGPVNAKSINQVATLGARYNHQIGIAAQGQDANEALAALKALIEANFGEEELAATEAFEARPTSPVQPETGQLGGIPASPGIAIGPITLYHLAPVKVSAYKIDDPQQEWQRLQSAIEIAHQEIRDLQSRAELQMGHYEAAIFDAHLLFLEDPALIETSRHSIFEQRINAEAAWQMAVEEMITAYRNLEDSYMQARAADVADVGQRVLKLLRGVSPTSPDLTQPTILVASDLTPSDIAQLNPDKVLGLCTELGSANSHSAILARAAGIPAVVGIGAGIRRLAEGTLLALDGQLGQVWIEPEPDIITELKAQRETWLTAQQKIRAASQQPAITKDGKQVEVAANSGGITDIPISLENGAEGVGLLRTEFLYLDRTTAPSEEEQFAVYQAMAEILGTRPLIIRTIDIGGDKPLPYLGLEPEANPFLGWRGIRFCLDQPEVFKTQLRAILRATPGHQIKIIFPMVASVSEVRAAKKLLAEARTELHQANIPFNETIEVGIMIEVPSAVVTAEELAAEVDFFSIGTNDLSQYILAADRTNSRVAAMADPFQPAVLRMIRQTIEAAHTAGIWVGLCGEFAGDPLATPILLGLGLDEFSMSSPAIPGVKQAISHLTMAEAETIAREALKLDSAEAVRQYVKEKISNQ